MKKSLLKCAPIVAVALLLSSVAFGQVPSQPGALQSLVGSAVRDLVSGRPPNGRFQLLPEPKFLLPQPGGGYSFVEFDRIPNAPTGNILTLRGEDLTAQLRRLADSVELGSPTLSSQQKAELRAARDLLYEDFDSNEFSELFKSYNERRKQFQELSARLGSATNTAERVNLQMQLRTVEQDWNLLGRREAVERAIGVLNRYSQQDAERLEEGWKAALAKQRGTDFSAIWPAIAGSSNWTTISASVSNATGTRMQLVKERDGVRTAEDISGVSGISMRVLVWRIRRPLLEHPFVSSPQWRSTQSFVLSDGVPATPSAPDADAELLPRVVASLVLVKSLEVTFSDDTSWRSVAQAIGSNEAVTLGGLTLKTPRAGSPFVSPRYLSLSAPFIVGVSVLELPKTPNPNPASDWPFIRY